MLDAISTFMLGGAVGLGISLILAWPHLFSDQSVMVKRIVLEEFIEKYKLYTIIVEDCSGNRHTCALCFPSENQGKCEFFVHLNSLWVAYFDSKGDLLNSSPVPLKANPSSWLSRLRK